MGHDLDDLALFVDAVRAGGVRAAAAARGVPRSTVSRRLARLEQRLGVSLAQRGRIRLRLTDAGEACYERMSRLVDEAREVAEEMSARGREPRGTLRIAATQAFTEHVLPELVARYLARHPRVRVEIVASTEHVDLAAERIDVAFRSGNLGDAVDLTARRLGVVEAGLFASPDYLRRRGAPSSVEELHEHDLLVAGQRSATTWTVRAGRALRPVRVQGRVLVESVECLRVLCERGAGIARFPTFLVADSLRRGALIPVLESAWVRAELSAVHRLAPPPKTRAFVALAREAFAAGEPWAAAEPQAHPPRRT